MGDISEIQENRKTNIDITVSHLQRQRRLEEAQIPDCGPRASPWHWYFQGLVLKHLLLLPNEEARAYRGRAASSELCVVVMVGSGA